MIDTAIEMELNFLDPADTEFTIDKFTGLNYKNKATGETFEDVQVKLMFPLTNKNHYLVISHEGRELGIIQNLDDLAPESRRVIDEILEKRYFVPEILQIHSVEEKYRLIHWKVTTDRGPMEFYTRTRNDIIVKGTRVYIRDIDSNRYYIKDHTKLSPQSQRELSSEI